MSAVLKRAIDDHLSGVPVPPGDVERARRHGTRRRRTRHGLAVLGVVVAVSAVVTVWSDWTAPQENTSVADYPAVGPFDASDGLRAYADPGHTIFLGGREFDASDLSYLDTDATATPAGVVFYDAGRPMLLGQSGKVTALIEGPVESSPGFHPTAKVDSAAPNVAWATLRDGVATIVVHDLETGDSVGSLDVECGDCDDLVIEALDEGQLFYRTDDGVSIWSVGDPSALDFAGPRTRIADVRNGSLLYDGVAPTSEVSSRYLTIPAPIDAQLTYDGRYILNWSSRLQNTRTTDPPIRLDAGPVTGLGFWTIDTDGSVLVAAPDGKSSNYLVHDCEIPSGACATLGPLAPRGGDPAFIGNDM